MREPRRVGSRGRGVPVPAYRQPPAFTMLKGGHAELCKTLRAATQKLLGPQGGHMHAPLQDV